MSFLEWIALGFIAVVAAFSLLDRLLARSFNADPAQRWSARDKVIVVTGASAGIGADLCRLWAALGARLVLVARRKDRLQAVADECAKLGALSTSICPADLSDREQCRVMVEKALELEGRIDCLVLNAGVSMSSYLEKVPDPAALQDLMAVNYFGCVYPAFYALPALQQRPFGTAKIVVVSSGTAKVSSPTRTGYAATKCALHGFFDALRIEVARRYGIGVTVVCPPTVATEIHTTRLAGSKSEFEPSTTMSSLQCAQMIVDAVAANKREELFRVTTKVAAVLRPLFPWLTDYVSILAMRKMGLFPENPLDPLDGKNSSDSKKSN